jgi:hypothetical protein
VRLYIFNFNDDKNYWKKAWSFALIFTLIIITIIEIFWRTSGHQTNITDDKVLWSMQREMIGHTDKEIILVGASRIQTGICKKCVEKMLPEYRVFNLSIDSSCPKGVLVDIANDEKIKGIIICSIVSEWILFCNNQKAFKDYIDFYHKEYNFNLKLNKMIGNLIQNNIVSVDPYLNLTRVGRIMLLDKELPVPNYVRTSKDRIRKLDYSKTDLQKHKMNRLKMTYHLYKTEEDKINLSAFIDAVYDLEVYVKKIQERGGTVVFVRFPIAIQHFTLDQKFYPKSIYWDTFSKITSSETIHFKEIEGMKNLSIPDTSHIDYKDSPKFTEILINEIKARGIVK